MKYRDLPLPARGERSALAVTVGDPCGVGPEITLKAVADERLSSAARLVVLGDERNLRTTAREQKLRWPFATVVHPGTDGSAVGASLAATLTRGGERKWDRPVLVDLESVDPGLLPGQVSASAGRSAARAIEVAVELALPGVVDGIVTAPIHKESLSLAGYSDPGHTEMLQRLTGAPRVGMLFWTEDFAVGLLSTHLSLADAIRRVRRTRILEQLLFVEREWSRYIGRRPRVVVAGLNPHASEGGRFGVEEARHVSPAIGKALARGLSVTGPVPPDAVFAQAREGQYDLVFALYHDQATIPVKTCYGRRAVNVTLGLPFVRTSVDHGTAMDIAGKGIASEESLAQAILLASRLVVARQRTS
jgi:4-hydroxythreonine-4-phosphate dehydrogenase